VMYFYFQADVISALMEMAHLVDSSSCNNFTE